MFSRFITISFFLLTLLLALSNVKKSKVRLQFADFNQEVIAMVVDLPLCGGASNNIIVEYKGKRYKVSVNKNDCIQGRYKIGDKINTIYNPPLDEIAPDNFVGDYRFKATIALFVLLFGVLYILILIYEMRKEK